MEKITNPSSIFLENCNTELPGVCKLDRTFFNSSGTLTGHTAMAEMLSKWLKKSAFIIPVNDDKKLCYI